MVVDSKTVHPGVLAAISYADLPLESFWLKRNLIYFSFGLDSSIFFAYFH